MKEICSSDVFDKWLIKLRYDRAAARITRLHWEIPVTAVFWILGLRIKAEPKNA